MALKKNRLIKIYLLRCDKHIFFLKQKICVIYPSIQVHWASAFKYCFTSADYHVDLPKTFMLGTHSLNVKFDVLLRKVFLPSLVIQINSPVRSTPRLVCKPYID